MIYQANKLDKYRLITEKLIVISILPFTVEKEIFVIQKCKPIISKVVFSKFLYLMANWTPYQKPIKEALTILKSQLKLLITSSYNVQKLVFLENQIIF